MSQGLELRTRQLVSNAYKFDAGKLRAGAAERLALEQVERKLEDKGRGEKK